MKIKLEILGQLRRYVKTPRAEWEVPEGITVNELLGFLEFPQWINKTPLLILINARLTSPKVQLQDGDKVTLLLSVGGG